jgi:outer membrane lipoprotein SlyB
LAPAPVQPEAPRPAPKQHAHRHTTEPAVHQTRTSNDDWRYEGGTRRVSTNDAGIDVIPSRPAPVPAAVTPPVCRECGTVENVHEVASQGEGSGLGAIAGGVLGGVLGHQVGRGTGKDLATIAGAVGGAFAGNQVEKNVRSNKQYEVAVRFDDGSVRSYTISNTAWHTGDRVRLSNGSLTPL